MCYLYYMDTTQNIKHPAGPGQAVKDEAGRIGITTDFIRASGPSKGKLCVMFVGANYEVAEFPADLTVIEL